MRIVRLPPLAINRHPLLLQRHTDKMPVTIGRVRCQPPAKYVIPWRGEHDVVVEACDAQKMHTIVQRPRDVREAAMAVYKQLGFQESGCLM
jgi:hypothetical protein